MKKIILIITTLILPFLTIGQGNQANEDSKVDYIKIISYAPEIVSKDVEQEYIVNIKYNLVSKESGKMLVAPWTPEWIVGEMENEKIPLLKKGEHEVEVKFTFTPTNHTHIQFSIIGEEPEDGSISILENANKDHCLDQFNLIYK